MVERTTRASTPSATCILIAGAALVCLPIYFVFVTGSLTQQQSARRAAALAARRPASSPTSQTAWQKANFGRLLLNSLRLAVGIIVGKIAVSLLAAFAVTYFRFPFRMTAFWLIFVSLMLPIEVRIVPTYESAANAALPLERLVDWLDLEASQALTAGTR